VSRGALPRRRSRHVALVGATATGKSALALEVARSLGDVEIVSVDSMQVYRGMDIGTAKASPAERAEIPHHLIDLADPAEAFSLACYQECFDDVLAEIEARGQRALLVGGTGLYLHAVVDRWRLPGRYPDVRHDLEAQPDTQLLHRRLQQLDPLAASRTEPGNRRRIVRALEVCLGSGRLFSSYGPGVDAFPPTCIGLVGLFCERDRLDQRIAARYQDQLAAGFLDEVAGLAARPGGLGPTARQALGYRELLAHLAGRVDLDDAIAEAVRRTCRFARRQERWFRRDPRIRWLDTTDDPLAPLEWLPKEWTTCT
jgi:tRNA dimethylallyltransferase